MRIPIENIGALARNIGAAVATGGTTVAGEALLTGGIAGLMLRTVIDLDGVGEISIK